MRSLISFILLIVISVVAGCNGKGSAGNNERGKQNTVTVNRSTIVATIEEEGEIAPLTSVEVKSSISGRVTRVLVNEGDYVRKGQVIAKVIADRDQTRSINNIINNYKEAEINYEKTKEDYEYAKDLFDNKFISERELRDAHNTYKVAEMRFASAEQEYQIAIQEISFISDSSERTSAVISPLSGIVLQRLIEPGELISSETSARSGTVLFNIADNQSFIVKVLINEFDIDRVKHNQPVVITRGRTGEQRLQGRVFKISPLAVQSDGVRVYPVEIEIVGEQESLRFGMTAAVRIITSRAENVLTIPVTSLFTNNRGEEYVMLKQPDGTFEPKQVRRGINNIFTVEITEGLGEGDIILSQGEARIPGQRGGGSGATIIPGMPSQGVGMRR